MGVKDLWHILSPVCEKKSLWELQNQTVAIDLSVWICENQQVDYSNNNLYLRNLFFRTSYMLLLNIKPIFVLDGQAPELKYNIIKQRKCVLYKSNFESVAYPERTGSRCRLRSLQKQCEELLKCMGIRCVHSEGEAEALCSALNSCGVVDGVITKDSDCFLYGARTVYRNFNISSNGGTFEKYEMSSIEKKLNLGRNKLIALSLLCGCDYNEKGIEGIGKECALKFLSAVTESEVLDKFSRWRQRPDEDGKAISKVEKTVKQKALLNPDFPFYDIQYEFLQREYELTNISFSWMQPNIRDFLLLTERKLGWNVDYAMEKFLPLFSRWHLLHDSTGNMLKIDHIVKKRILRGVPSYEVKWKDFDHCTVEPMSYLKLKYQNIIDNYEIAKQVKIKKVLLKNRRPKKYLFHWMM